MANSEADGQSKPFEIAPDTEIQRRAREVQFLLNVVEPDPEYQPFVLTDEASLFDAVGHDEDDSAASWRVFRAAVCLRPKPAGLALGGRDPGMAARVARGVLLGVNQSVEQAHEADGAPFRYATESRSPE